MTAVVQRQRLFASGHNPGTTAFALIVPSKVRDLCPVWAEVVGWKRLENMGRLRTH